MSRDQLAARLHTIFLGELDEQVRAMNADLLALEEAPGDPERLRALFRAAHTLKGAARAAGVPPAEEVCHALEALLAQARDGKLTLRSEHFALLFGAADALGDAGQRMRAGQTLDDAPLARVAPLLRDAVAGAPIEPAEIAPAAPVAPVPMSEGRGDQVRVEAEKVDALLAAGGELLTATGRVAARPRQLRELHEIATRWARRWRRLARQARQGVDPAAVSRGLDEVTQGLDQLVDVTDHLATAVVEDARLLAHIADDLGQGLRRLRMYSFADASAALPRVVRDLTTAAQKEARLEIVGGAVEADGAVLDGLREALLHLVRNAVDHGIEPAALRIARGKPRIGTVTVAAALGGDRLIVTVSDDGAGLDLPAIRERLARRGTGVPDDERQLARMLFQGGVSTRARATEISGRGVGLDAARAAVERIGGTLDVTWTEGQGTTFVLECPPTLAVLRAILVQVDGHVLALPTASIERLDRVQPDELRPVQGRQMLPTAEGPVPLVALARLLGPPFAERPVAGRVPVVRFRTGDGRRLAVTVDELLTEQEVMVRPLDQLRSAPPLVAGAALLGTGEVALVLHPAAAVAAGLDTAGEGLALAPAATSAPARRRILVADDSITTRTLEQSVLEAAGYIVQTAVDGAEAWRLLQEQPVDLVVSDVEMPRMDGFALCEAIRGSRRFGALPVILVTALEAPEHRRRGLEAGADAYIAKSSFDQQELLDTIRQLLG